MGSLKKLKKQKFVSNLNKMREVPDSDSDDSAFVPLKRAESVKGQMVDNVSEGSSASRNTKTGSSKSESEGK